MEPKLGWLPTQGCSSQQHQAEQAKRRGASCAEEAWSPRNGPCCCCGWGRFWAPDGFSSPPNGLGELCHSSRKDSSDSLLLSLLYSFIQLLEPKSVPQLFQHLPRTVGFSLKDAQNLGASRVLRCHNPTSPHRHTHLLLLLAPTLAALTFHLCAAARNALCTHQSDHVSLLRRHPQSLLTRSEHNPPPQDWHLPPKDC